MVLSCCIVRSTKLFRYVTTLSKLPAILTLSKKVLLDKALSCQGSMMICYILSIYIFTWGVSYIAL